MEKQFVQIQLGLFFKNNFDVEPENASLAIKEQFVGTNMTTQVLGVPVGAPAEIPRVIANSELVNINLSKNRIDFFSKQENFVQDNFEKFFNLIEKLSVSIGRVGVVVTYFKETDISELKAIFNQEKITGLKPSEITTRFSEQAVISKVVANNSQMYVFSSVTDSENRNKTGIIITRDINSLAEEMTKNEFSRDSLIGFVEAAIIESKKTLI